MSAPAMNIEQRVTVSLALQRYLRAVERFEAASNDACLRPPSKGHLKKS